MAELDEAKQTDYMLGDATTTVETSSQASSKQTGVPLGGLFSHLAQEAESVPNAFGSPQAPSKILDFDSAKAPTPVPAPSPPTPTMQPLSPVPLPVSPATPAPAPAASSTITAAPAATPLPGGGAPAAEENVDGAIDYDTFVKDTLLWVNKVRSAVYLLGGLLAIYVLHRLLSSDVTLVTGVCWLLLAQAGLNFVRGFINPKLQARCTWQDSSITSSLINVVTNAAKGAAALHDKHMVGADAGKLLRIVAVLWAVSLAGRLAGATSLAATLWVLAFVLPKAYALTQAKVDKAVADALTQAKAHFVKLDAKVRAAAIVVPTFVAGYALSSVDLAIAVLALALYGRSCMAQAQVEKLNAAVAPAITNTVTKVGGTMGTLVQSAVVKYDLTPTPAKGKRD